MSFFSGTVFSNALLMQTSLRVIIPDNGMQNSKVLYLLHGLSDDSSIWMRKTCIEQFAEDHDYAVIMPEVNRSFYTDIDCGGKYFTYITKELPEICERLFGFRHSREKTFVAGLSMGGYGALKCALRHPEQYAACASFSGAVDVQGLLNTGESIDVQFPEHGLFFGKDRKLDPSLDLFKLAVEVNKLPTAQKPRVLTTCGYQDFLYAYNIGFRDLMNSLDFDYKYIEWEGAHTWPFWNTSIQYALSFFDGHDLTGTPA